MKPKRGRPVGTTKGTVRVVAKLKPEHAAWLRERGISKTIAALIEASSK